MSARRAKQVLYGTFYGIIWVVIFYGIYLVFLRPITAGPSVPVCGDFCLPPGVKPIALHGSVYSFTASPGAYTFLAEVANTNDGYAVDSFDYTFTAYDASDTPLASFTGESFIYANELKYLVAPNETIAGPIDHIGLTVTNAHWIPGETLGTVPALAFQNMAAGSSSSTVFVSGEIENKDIESFSKVFIVGIWSDADGNPVGASDTEVDGLAPGALQNFSVIYPAASGIDPAANQVFAYALKGD